MASRKREEGETFENYRTTLREKAELDKVHKAGYYISVQGKPLRQKVSVRNLLKMRQANGTLDS